MYNGLSGLLKGFFMKVDEHIKIADLTTVPIAIPMIAGPATITAAVTFPVQYSRFVTIVAILLAFLIFLQVNAVWSRWSSHTCGERDTKNRRPAALRCICHEAGE